MSKNEPTAHIATAQYFSRRCNCCCEEEESQSSVAAAASDIRHRSYSCSSSRLWRETTDYGDQSPQRLTQFGDRRAASARRTPAPRPARRPAGLDANCDGEKLTWVKERARSSTAQVVNNASVGRGRNVELALRRSAGRTDVRAAIKPCPFEEAMVFARLPGNLHARYEGRLEATDRGQGDVLRSGSCTCHASNSR